MKPIRRTRPFYGCVSTLVLLCGVSAWSQQLHFGGGPRAATVSNCITPADQQEIEALIAQRGPEPQDVGIIPYPFVPIAGTVWDDRFINNYVDLDATSGIKNRSDRASALAG